MNQDPTCYILVYLLHDIGPLLFYFSFFLGNSISFVPFHSTFWSFRTCLDSKARLFFCEKKRVYWCLLLPLSLSKRPPNFQDKKSWKMEFLNRNSQIWTIALFFSSKETHVPCKISWQDSCYYLSFEVVCLVRSLPKCLLSGKLLDHSYASNMQRRQPSEHRTPTGRYQ